MTNEELLSYIKEHDCYVIPKGNFVIDGINVTDAIEKQKAKPVDAEWREYGDSGRYWYWCPTCQCEVDDDNDCYCPACGQHLDWSEDND